MVTDHGHGSASGSQALAIDVLLEPDARLAEAAKAVNARLRAAYPGGYALDESHVPHITIVQLFLSAEGLGSLCAPLSALAAAPRLTDWRLRATGLDATAYGELGLVSIRIERTPELVAFQDAVVHAAQPFAEGAGDARGFVPREDGGPISALTVRDVNEFVPRFTGERYRPHVTVGVVARQAAAEMASQSFTPFTFAVTGLRVYRLGDFGTARERLWP